MWKYKMDWWLGRWECNYLLLLLGYEGIWDLGWTDEVMHFLHYTQTEPVLRLLAVYLLSLRQIMMKMQFRSERA